VAIGVDIRTDLDVFTEGPLDRKAAAIDLRLYVLHNHTPEQWRIELRDR
jgi:hypothetical protein